MEIVAHRAGNAPDLAAAALGFVDMIELDVHVLRGRVEVRHAKVLRPTTRLWEKWYLLPAGSAGVAIADVLEAIPETTPLMIDLKCFTTRSSRKVLASLPAATPIVASTRNWWVLGPFKQRANTRVLHSCGTKWQLWWALNVTTFSEGFGVCVREHRLSPKVWTQLRNRTPLVFSWGVETRDRAAELERAGITGVIVDDYRPFSTEG